MAPRLRPVVGSTNAFVCTFISIFGVLILSCLGYGFDHGFDALMGSIDNPEDGHAVAKTCYSAAMIYAILIAFCGCQLTLNRRIPRGEIQL
ncbi:hypothetical protein BS47DRAFT_1325434 [Hydnum rufescens UP504]|uniref:Uncharacterized protein n=1 Tax=Hydnum rufescens UP504 TaxID=1448309 RepID=A0A9P6B651_9AGAM|nr:hypothetical protein BS47DRAFT_1325434 [Hydnum rufescens UP504]